MKTPQKYINCLYQTKDGEPISIHDSIENVIDVIEQAQIEAYNEAIESAVINAKVIRCEYNNPFSTITHLIDKQSILKLKK